MRADNPVLAFHLNHYVMSRALLLEGHSRSFHSPKRPQHGKNGSHGKLAHNALGGRSTDFELVKETCGKQNAG